MARFLPFESRSLAANEPKKKSSRYHNAVWTKLTPFPENTPL